MTSVKTFKSVKTKHLNKLKGKISPKQKTKTNTLSYHNRKYLSTKLPTNNGHSIV